MVKKSNIQPIKKVKNRKHISAFLASKFNIDFTKAVSSEVVLKNDEKIQVVKAFIEIVDMVKQNHEWKNIYEKYQNDIREKYRNRFNIGSGLKLLDYFNNHAIMNKSIGNGEWDFYTMKEFNELPDSALQLLSDKELYSLFFYISNCLNNELEILLRKGGQELGVIDNRVKGKLTKDEIQKYFLTAFSKKQKDQNPILSEAQIKHFLQANFVDFIPMIEVEKFETPNTTQQKIRKIVHDFYLMHSPQTKTDIYIHLLKNNFSKFDNSVFSSEKSNFHK